jgi:UDP-3-O-[3-hydroxymyristoyl] N-acetylglucosamine deacetylase
MTRAPQTTVARPAEAEGIGLHGGQRARVRLAPAPAGSGVVFARMDLPGAPRFCAHEAEPDPSAAQRRTELVGPDGLTRVTTPEHLLAACLGLGLDNVLVELDGPELPIFDGSAQPLVELIDRAGIVPLKKAPRRPWRLLRPVVLAEEGREIVAIPAKSMQLAFFATMAHAGIPDQAVQIELAQDRRRSAFRAIAPARTFVFYEEVEKLRQAGLIRGGSLDCAIILRDGHPIAESGDYRLPNELACHKLLDLLGDLALLGRPIDALVTARGSGHAMHQAFLKLLAKEIEE